MTLEQAFAQLPSIEDRFDRMFTKEQAEAIATLIRFAVNQSVQPLVASDIARQNVHICTGIGRMYRAYLDQGVPEPVAQQMIRDYQYMVLMAQRKE